MESFLSGDFARSEKLADRLASQTTTGRTDEVVLIRALSLMKLDRFEEARPLLEGLRRDAASAQLRAQAAYSLGDSYYFSASGGKNMDRAQADLYYKQALERFPDHGEAQQVRRLLGTNGSGTVN